MTRAQNRTSAQKFLLRKLPNVQIKVRIAPRTWQGAESAHSSWPAKSARDTRDALRGLFLFCHTRMHVRVGFIHNRCEACRPDVRARPCPTIVPRSGTVPGWCGTLRMRGWAAQRPLEVALPTRACDGGEGGEGGICPRCISRVEGAVKRPSRRRPPPPGHSHSLVKVAL